MSGPLLETLKLGLIIEFFFSMMKSYFSIITSIKITTTSIIWRICQKSVVFFDEFVFLEEKLGSEFLLYFLLFFSE